jgi:predicted DsbA family dithiol-disulfide isomerase
VRIEKLKQKFDIEIKLVHFPLHPDTPTEGRSMADLFAGRDYDPDASYNRMKAMMDEEGLPYSKRTHTYNSRLAQELGAWAETQPGGEAIHDALYTAYFVDGKNVGDTDVLLEIVAAVGLPVEAAREVLAQRSFEAVVDADWSKSHSYGVTGVPTFVAGGYGVVGAQPYEALEQLMREVGAQERSGDPAE